MRCQHFERRQQAAREAVCAPDDFFEMALLRALPAVVLSKGWKTGEGAAITSVTDHVQLAIEIAACLTWQFFPRDGEAA